MAGVNLNEENARILATNSELVGTQIRSCKDETFLQPGLLHRRILEIGKTRWHLRKFTSYHLCLFLLSADARHFSALHPFSPEQPRPTMMKSESVVFCLRNMLFFLYS